MAVLALLPAAGLLFYIYKMDRFDKEPIGLFIGLFFLGVGSVIPAIILELLAGGVLNVLFGGSFDSDAIFFSSTGSQYFYEFLNNFFCIALHNQFTIINPNTFITNFFNLTNRM